MEWSGKTPTPDEMRAILEAHSRWWRSEDGGTRANLTDADLRGADLTGADLRGADLTGADLRGANLTGADLTGADLRGANLTGADLRGANLTDADLRRANLTDADLRGAYLTDADLRGANLTDADLRGAYLRGANLTGADLRGANLTDADLRRANLTDADLRGAYLTGADLTGADLRGANLTDAQGAGLAIARTRILPAGDLIGWKKCQKGKIVKLRIPADARRSHAFGRKCRAEYADVLEVIGAQLATTQRCGPKTEYSAGQRVTPDSWDDDWTHECSHGIYFYITREEAEAHE